ncbi:MAG TPA: CehA/McbA family metallohydrolase [Gemmatimonadales bacterium]|nr:CehA/McbA family metallohydrolase [Gemmatimonadales bacterium]
MLSARGAAAQREPVLRQIKLPHNYYYREMYLPQVTSGPSAVTWSPDGRSLVYSMQGRLWRQTIGDSTAEQVTTGPSYDYQPDWSPDGRRIVYVSYRNDALELWLLDATTLDAKPLLADGAVNLEPRWSPDGARIAYVSTAYEGRFHVWTVGVPSSGFRVPSGDSASDTLGTRNSAHGTPIRLTEDRDSHLPRYYYSVYDHYLSPTWSPDGKSLILVSNRGSIWGTGGFWKMEAKLGAPLVPVHDEETTWRASPDWSLDGKRVLYSSYLGRQWHQLWLTTADGGDPFQLTYGDFDVTSARWSPDSRRIAYISNQEGNTALYVMDVTGGAREKVVPRRRVYREPVGRLTVRVTDSAGRALPARVSVTLADGRSAAPDDAWRYADDGFDRHERSFEVGYFHTDGSSTLTVPSGPVKIEVTHGPAWRMERRMVTVRANASEAVTVELRPLMALPGWTAGDLHVHMNYGGHYRATPATLAKQARAEGLNLVENLIVNKEDRMPDIGYFTPRPDPVSTPDLMIVHDQEFHTSWWGHLGLLGLTDHILLPGYAGYAGTPAASLFPDNATVAELAHRQQGLVGYVHPFDTDPDPADTTTPLTNGLPMDVALGRVDYMEVVGFSDHLATSKVWYRLLNCGFRIPTGAGTDAMTNFASLRGPVGMNRVYVESPLPIDRRRWYAGLKAGRSFATNGPMLRFTLDGAGLGSELTLSAPRTLTARLALRSNVPIDHLQLIHNGVVAAEIPLAGDRTRADTTIRLRAEASGWYVLRAYSDKAIEPVLDIYPFGTTSPIYVTVAGKPVRSAADADFFLRWLARLTEAAQAHGGWNSGEEKRGVLQRIHQAEEEFARRR